MAQRFTIPDSDVEIKAILAHGSGGQNVNKVATAIQLRFDIVASSLPAAVKQRLLACGDHRISRDGVLVIKAQNSRSQEQNRTDALKRLHALVGRLWQAPTRRKATRPTKASRTRRLDSKTRHGQKKSLRKKIDYK